MTKREAIGILKNTEWIASIEKSKRIAKAIETLQEPMDKYRNEVKRQYKINKRLQGHLLFMVGKLKEQGADVEYNFDDMELYFPVDWL